MLEAQIIKPAILEGLSGLFSQRGLVEFSQAEREMPIGSPMPGHFRVDVVPAAHEVYRAFSDPAVRRVSVMACAQALKTEFALSIVCHTIAEDPAPLLYVVPTGDLARRFGRRLDKALDSCPAARAKIGRRAPSAGAPEGKKREGDALHEKTYPGGALYLVSSGSVGGLLAESVKVAILDECDRFESEDVGQAVDNRMTTYQGTGKRIELSTPIEKHSSRIAAWYDMGTREVWQVQCRACKEWQEWVWDRVRFERKDAAIIEGPVYGCAKCGSVIDEMERREMNRRGRWLARVPFNPETGHRSFHLSAMASPFISMETLAREFAEANHALEIRSDPGHLARFYMDRLGVPFLDHRGQANADALQANCRRRFGDSLPDGCLMLTMAGDVQDDALVYEVRGWGLDGDPRDGRVLTYGLGYDWIRITPADIASWENLLAVFNRIWRHQFAHLDMLPVRLGVDIGGHHTEAVKKFVERRGHGERRVIPLKGAPDYKAKLLTIPKKMTPGWRNRVCMIGTQAAKDIILSMLKDAPYTKGESNRCLWEMSDSAGYNEDYFIGLTRAERKVPVTRNGQRAYVWQHTNTAIHNEPLDLFVYNLAMLHHAGGAAQLARNRAAIARRLELMDRGG